MGGGQQCWYLRVDISSNISWNTHVDRVATNANRSLGFITRNIKTKSPKVQEMAYQTLVRPQIIYASDQLFGTPTQKKRLTKLR